MRNVKNLVQFLVCAAFSLSVPYFNIDPCITVWMDVLEILKTIPTCTNPNIKSIATVCTVKNVSIVIASVHALAHQSRVPASPARKSTIVLRICWMHACNNKDYRKCRPVCERDTWRWKGCLHNQTSSTYTLGPPGCDNNDDCSDNLSCINWKWVNLCEAKLCGMNTLYECNKSIDHEVICIAHRMSLEIRKFSAASIIRVLRELLYADDLNFSRRFSHWILFCFI